MKMLVLAGGFGTRLKSVVGFVPKALAPVGPIPFLEVQIAQWKAQGLRSFVFLLHHQAELIIAFLQGQAGGLLADCDVRWLVEPEPLDTGGAVAFAVRTLCLEGEFLLTNADTWLGGGVQDVAGAPAPALGVVYLVDNAVRYGRVRFGANQRVTRFEEKGQTRGPGWINAGLCKLDAGLFAQWDGRPFSLERVNLTRLAASGALSAVPLQTDFIDIGVPVDYRRFCDWIHNDRQGHLCN